jgi:hypothetical protein
MAQLSVVARQRGFGATARRDLWWVGPLVTFLVLTGFLIYAHWRVFQGAFSGKYYFEIRENRQEFSGRAVAPYLAPFYAPLLYDETSEHAWIKKPRPGWWPFGFFTSAMLILAGPATFRLTCYYYRKAYYRSFWHDPPGCAVGEWRKSYWGERRLPLVLQNVHRYTMYIAVGFLLLLWWDALVAFWWPTDRQGNLLDGRQQFGMGLGTLFMVVNCVLLSGYTLGCHSLRHLVGGRLDCFSCTGAEAGGSRLRTGYHLWSFVTRLNEHHMFWAWVSMFSVGLTDYYIMLCASGAIDDVRFF